jgi:DNA-binding MarR family transcriptional regulator
VPRTQTDPVLVATELRVALGRLVRRLRAENVFSLSRSVVMGRLDREGAQSVSDLAAAEHVRPQSMAQTVRELECDGLVHKRPDPDDRRRTLVALTELGTQVLRAERRRREGWLAKAIANDLDAEEQAVLSEAVELLKRLAGSDGR